MNWIQTTDRTWQATCDRGALYVTRRRPKPGVLEFVETYWPTVNIGGRTVPLMREESLEAAQAACEREMGLVPA